MATKIFISYANDDFPRVHDVSSKLQELGFDVWMDIKNLHGGKLWRPELVQAIRECDAFLIFISVTSMQSVNVRREVDLASEKGKKIIPIRLDAIDIVQELQFQLAGIQWLDASKSDWVLKLLIALGRSEEQPAFQGKSSYLEDSPVSSGNDELKDKENENHVGGVYFGGGNIRIGGDVVGRDQTKRDK